jgi:hypothetical protein
MQKPHDNSKVCRAAFVQDSTLVVVIEMALTSWLVAGMIPGVDREPLKKIAPDERRPSRWATNGHYSPLSGAREVGVTFNSKPPTGRAEVLSISKVASVPAVGELSEI